MEGPINNCTVADLDHLTNSLCSALVSIPILSICSQVYFNLTPPPDPKLDPPRSMGTDLHKGGSICYQTLASLEQWATLQLLEAASRLRFVVNAFVPINQLPPEILCEVFFHLRPAIRTGSRRLRLPFEDLLTVTHTC